MTKVYKIPDDAELYSGNGHSPMDGGSPYDPDFMGNNQDRFNQVLEIPDIDEMASVFARSVFKNERQRNAAVRLYYRHAKFNDKQHQELLRMLLAATVGMNGRGRVDGLFATTGMLAPDMYRTVAGLPKNRKGEEEKIIRGSDFRREEKANNNLGNQQ